jgi:hypothetical protein
MLTEDEQKEILRSIYYLQEAQRLAMIEILESMKIDVSWNHAPLGLMFNRKKRKKNERK